MKMRILSLIVFAIIFSASCLTFSYNNRWKIPNTDLSVLIERSKPETFGKMYERDLIFQENFLTKNKIEMAPENGEYSRANVYRTSDKTYLIKDYWNSYEINIETKTIKKLDAAADNENDEFIGAFDKNESGGWRFIPSEEREELTLGERNTK